MRPAASRCFAPSDHAAADWPRRVGRAVARAARSFSETCRRIRAYNHLKELDAATIRAVGRDRATIESVLAGYPPPRRKP